VAIKGGQAVVTKPKSKPTPKPIPTPADNATSPQAAAKEHARSAALNTAIQEVINQKPGTPAYTTALATLAQLQTETFEETRPHHPPSTGGAATKGATNGGSGVATEGAADASSTTTTDTTAAATTLTQEDVQDEPLLSRAAASKLAEAFEQLTGTRLDPEALRRMAVVDDGEVFTDDHEFQSTTGTPFGYDGELEEGSPPSHDPTEYEKRQARLLVNYKEFIGRASPTGARVIQWIKGVNAKTTARTPGEWCVDPTGRCTNDTCCVRELQTSTWDSRLGCLAGHTQLRSKDRAAIGSRTVKQYLRARLKVQIKAGRVTTKAHLISTTSVENLCSLAIDMANEALCEGDLIEHVALLQWAAILSIDCATGRRNADISRADSRRVFFTDLNGQPAIILELLEQKVLSSPGLTVAFGVPGHARDPVLRLQAYLDAARLTGLPLQKSHLLFPKIARGQVRDFVWGLRKPNARSDYDFQHASTSEMNTRLKTLMAPAGVPEAERNFRIHGVRTAKVLAELDKGTDTATLNKLLGWVPKSLQWQAYARLRQMAALLASPAGPAVAVKTALDTQSLALRAAVQQADI
jgi:hypothetical protein